MLKWLGGLRARLWAALLPWWGRLPIPDGLRWAMMWAVNQKFLIGVGAVVFDEQRRVLLFKHTYREDYLWGLPGGWLEKGEDPARAVEREVREETGLEVRVTRPLFVETGRSYPSLYITFVGSCLDGTFRPSAEVSEVGVFALPDLPALHPDTVRMIELAYHQEETQTMGMASGSM